MASILITEQADRSTAPPTPDTVPANSTEPKGNGMPVYELTLQVHVPDQDTLDKAVDDLYVVLGRFGWQESIRTRVIEPDESDLDRSA